jgi:hypothetical protein
VQTLFTKSGIGRTATQLVLDRLTRTIHDLLSTDTFKHHPTARADLLTLSERLLSARFPIAVDQVENVIKPYKYDLEITVPEWDESARRALQVMEQDLARRRADLDALQRAVGKRKLRAAMLYVEEQARRPVSPIQQQQSMSAEKSDSSTPSNQFKHHQQQQQQQSPIPFSDRLLATARHALEIQLDIHRLQTRMYALRPGWVYASPCASSYALRVPHVDGSARQPTKALCPETLLAYLSGIFVFVF